MSIPGRRVELEKKRRTGKGRVWTCADCGRKRGRRECGRKRGRREAEDRKKIEGVHWDFKKKLGGVECNKEGAKFNCLKLLTLDHKELTRGFGFSIINFEKKF